MSKKGKDKSKSKHPSGSRSTPADNYLVPADYQELPRGYGQMYDASEQSRRTSAITSGVGGMQLTYQPNAVISAPMSSGGHSRSPGTALNYREVKVSGSTIEGDAIGVNELALFHVNITRAGPSEPGIIITDPCGDEVEIGWRQVQRGIFECSFTPRVTGQHSVSVCFAGMNIKGSPFKANVVDSVPVVPKHQSTIRPKSESVHQPSRHRPALTKSYSLQDSDIQPDRVLDMLDPDLRSRIEPYITTPIDFRKGKILGEGEFGNVSEVRVQWKGTGSHMYAAKTLNDFDKNKLDEFFREADLMNNFKHSNVLPLKGLVIWSGQPYILVPIMKHGNLKEHLERHKNSLEKTTLIDYAYQVAFGMEYVSNLRIVHRDLAARNCLLNAGGVVKISDFGLARDNFKQNYVMLNRQKRLPIRWMAPEVTTNWTFTTETDVWAYGILLWEIFTYGSEPYAGTDDGYLVAFLKFGNRLEKPEHATDDLYELMLACWKLDKGDRPNFASIAYKLKLIIKKEGGMVMIYKNLD